MNNDNHKAPVALNKAKPRLAYLVVGLSGDGEAQQRLAALGFVRGAEVTVLQYVAGGAKVRVNGFNLAMDCNALSQVLVEKA